jgi:LmbE family N-acetylglucosaminyl deacetylase
MTSPDLAVSALEGSVLIVAHPDDEVLWFGSVAAQVDKIVVCFLNDPAKPELRHARERTIESHPWRDRLVCLGLDETGSFGLAGWPRPDIMEYGLKIERRSNVAIEYQSRFQQLRDALTPFVRGANNVFTHNPWGEYGHEEHVLVNRAATTLAEESGTTVWYSNYASTWSEDLMRRYLDRQDRPVFRGSVPITQMQETADVYREHGAWTWFDDYAWFAEEFFTRGPLDMNDAAGFGWLFPVNFIHLPQREEPVAKKRDSRFRRFLRRNLR